MALRNGYGNRYNSGWIKLHRQIIDWEWYQNTNTSRVFIHLLLSAARKPNQWNGMELLPGQLITSRRKLANDLGLSEREIRTVLATLKKTHELTIKTTHLFSILTICKWNTYQGKESASDPQKDPQKAHKTTTNKNNKEEKNNVITPFPKNGEQTNLEFKSKKGKSLVGEDLVNFSKFWNDFNFKVRRDEAIDAWLNIENLTPNLVERICSAAAIEAKRAAELTRINQARKHAAGWLAGRRWEDEIYNQTSKSKTVFNLNTSPGWKD